MTDSIGNGGEIIMYESDDGATKLAVQLDGETVWLTQAQMAELFKTTKQNVSLHISNAIEEGELDPAATVKESLTVQQEGSRTVKRKTRFYNLDVIISVGYRVKSIRGVHFRRWATSVLRDYIVKGFALDDARLKRGDSSYWKVRWARILHTAIFISYDYIFISYDITPI